MNNMTLALELTQAQCHEIEEICHEKGLGFSGYFMGLHDESMERKRQKLLGDQDPFVEVCAAHLKTEEPITNAKLEKLVDGFKKTYDKKEKKNKNS